MGTCVLAYGLQYVQNEAVDVLTKLGAKCTIWEARMEGERWRFAGIDARSAHAHKAHSRSAYDDDGFVSVTSRCHTMYNIF